MGGSPAHRRLKVGIIGAGAWAIQSHLRVLAERQGDVELWAICRRNREELNRLRDQYGFRHAFTDFRDAAASGLDVGIVTSPAAQHYEHALALLQHNAHVLVEKPFTVAARDAWRLVRLARRRRLHLAVSYGYNYLPLASAAQRLLSEGDGLGKLEFLSIHMGSGVRALLRGGQAFDPGARHRGWQPRTYADPDVAGGGYAQTQLTHALGLGLWLTGARANLAAGMLYPASARVEFHDAFVVRYRGGAIGTVSGTAAHAGGGSRRHQLTVRAVGSRGQIHLDVEGNLVTYTDSSGRTSAPQLEPAAGVYNADGPVHAILDLALGRTSVNPSPGELGARVTELIEAAYLSAHAPEPSAATAPFPGRSSR